MSTTTTQTRTSPRAMQSTILLLRAPPPQHSPEHTSLSCSISHSVDVTFDNSIPKSVSSTPDPAMVDKKDKGIEGMPGRDIPRYTLPVCPEHNDEDQYPTSMQEVREARDHIENRAAPGNDRDKMQEGGEKQSTASDLMREVNPSCSSSSKKTTSRFTRIQSLFHSKRMSSKGKGIATYEPSEDCAPSRQETLGNAYQQAVDIQQEGPGTLWPTDASTIPGSKSAFNPFEASARASAFAFRADPMSAEGDLSLPGTGSSVNEQRQKSLGSAPSTSSTRGTSTSSSFSSFPVDSMPAEGDLSIQKVGDEGKG